MNIRSITIDYTKIGSTDLTNFPLLFAGTYTYLKTTANGGEVASNSGYDILFYADASLTTLLPFERVAWSGTTGNCQFFIKIPTVSHTTNTTIYLATGDNTVITDQQDRTGTWNSNFTGVWHFEGNSNDATSNALNGSDQNGVTYSTTNSAIGAGQGAYLLRAYPAASPWINLGTSTLTCPTGAFIAGGWIRTSDVTVLDMNIFTRYDIYAGINTKSWQIAISTLYGSHPEYIGHLVTATSSDGSNNFYSVDPDILVNDTWYRVFFMWNGSDEVSIWKNGVKVATVATTGIYQSVNNRTAFGIEAETAGSTLLWDGNYLGDMDEMIFYTGLPSQSFMTADYNNQSSPSTFYSVSSYNPGGSVNRTTASHRISSSSKTGSSNRVSAVNRG